MPYVQTNVHEGAFITEFMQLLKEKGNWTIGEKFFKVGIPVAQLGNPTGSIENATAISFAIAQHQQATNSKGAVFGLARVYTFTILYVDLPSVFKSKASVLDEAKVKEMHDYILTKWPTDEDNTVLLDNSKFYTYMCKEKTAIPTDYLYASASTAASVLDVELAEYKAKLVTSSDSSSLTILFDDVMLPANKPLTMQSPITEVKMRISNEMRWATNWWPDSLVTVQGWIDEEVVAVVLQSDPAAAPDDALVPIVPLYWGAVKSLDTASDGSIDHTLFAGTAPPLSTYDFDSPSKFLATPMMPTLKKYTKYPANGIDDIIVMRTKQGAYYQNHFIKAFNPPNKMPPDRKIGSKQFPSAWKDENNDEYTYPAVSTYTQKRTISPAYIEHPEERSRGELKKIMLVTSVGLKKGTDLQVALGTCPETYAYYKLHDIDAISPLTKRPSTQYRPMMLAIFEGDKPQ